MIGQISLFAPLTCLALDRGGGRVKAGNQQVVNFAYLSHPFRVKYEGNPYRIENDNCEKYGMFNPSYYLDIE